MSLYIDGDVYSRPYTYECNPQVINQIKTDVVTFKSDPDKWLIGAKLRQSTYTCPHGSYGNSTIVARFGGGWDPMTGEYSVVDAYRGISGMVNRATRFPLYGPYPDDVASIYVYGTVDNSYVPPTDQKIHVHITLDGEDLVDQVVSTGDKWPASGTNYYFTTDVGEIRLSKTSGDFVVMQSDKDEDLYLKDYKVTGTVLNDDKIVWNKNGNASLKSTWYDERRPVEIELNYVKDPTKWQIMRVHTTTLNGEENTLETLFAASRNKGGYKYLSDCIYNVTLGDRTSDKYIQAYVETRQGGHVLSHSYPEDRNIIYEEDPVDNNYVEKYRFKLAYVDFNLNEPIDIYITADWRNELFQMVNFHFTVDGVEQEVIKRTMVK